MVRLLVLAAACLAASAQASGFYFTDNGVKAMLQGGAFTAQADDLSAMQWNPAGLTALQGFSFLADLQVLRHDVSFNRQDDPSKPNELIPSVSSKPDPYLLPLLGLSYGFELGNRPFTVALGLVAPPSQGRYDYPVPDYTKDGDKYVNDPRRNAPQRYALIRTDILIAYPTLSLAYAIHPRFQVGLSAQLTVSHFAQTQTLYGGDTFCSSTGPCSGGFNPMAQLQEDPNYDATVSIDLPGQVGFTGVLGLMAKPTDWLSLGASIRPPIPFKARGKLNVQLSQFFQSAGATVEGDTATLEMTMPLEIRVGARVKPISRLGINLDFVYLGWNSVDRLLLTPENVFIVNMGNRTPIAPVSITKAWQPSYSVRLGGTFQIIKPLDVSAGVLFETGAAQTATYSVDWTHPTRVMLTAGLTGHVGPIDLLAGGFYVPTNTTVVSDSQVLRGQTNPDIVSGAVGNGTYVTSGWGLLFGVRGNFGAPARAATPVEPEQKPVKLEEPAPAVPAETTPPTAT